MPSLKKNPLISGTLILTVTGLISRTIGFFYRINLSRLFGEESMGIYQLLGPILALSFSLTAAGLQTAISKYFASETSTNDYSYSLQVLIKGLFISILLSVLTTYFIYHWSDFLAVSFLKEARTASMLRIIALSVPLSANRIAINFLQSIEAIYIPNRLLLYGYDTKTALSVYGVLTGMALPLILFPNALTGSVSVLLLPIVSEADALGQKELIKKTIMKTVRYCSLLGFICLLFFFLFGRFLGSMLFNSSLAGHFIVTLSFICPFLYLGSTLSSILHGLGKASQVFLINVFSLSIRLGFVFFAIPKFGIFGYLCGLLCSQCVAVLLYFLFLSLRHRSD